MDTEKTTEEPASRDAANWARQVEQLEVGDVPAEAINRNVDGRRVTGPIQGFGKMWQKTYRVALAGVDVTPAKVVSEWKANFASFWPERNWFYGPMTGIEPGEVAVLNLTMPGRIKLSTGVFVLYADEESFTFMTPQGHMFAGWITFSAAEEDGITTAQVHILMRAHDPLSELGLTLGGHKLEDRFWEATLERARRPFRGRRRGRDSRCLRRRPEAVVEGGQHLAQRDDPIGDVCGRGAGPHADAAFPEDRCLRQSGGRSSSDPARTGSRRRSSSRGPVVPSSSSKARTRPAAGRVRPS